MVSSTYHYGLGRRKSAIATARLYSGGKGSISINDQPANVYLADSEKLLWELSRPLTLIGQEKEYDITLKVKGGGQSGQIDACKLAIAKAVAELNEDLRSTLKKGGFLKRDPREKERKKFGLKRARKREQFSKR